MLSSRTGRTGRAALCAAIAASVATGGLALGVTPASAATPFTITSISPHLVSALSVNQVITITGTGFSEEDLAGVAIAGCTTAPSYIVASATSLVLKTAGDCAVGTGRVVTLTDAASNTLVSTPGSATAAVAAAHKLDFVAAPTISVTATTHPVVQANTSAHTQLDQVRTAPVGGGTTVKVTAGATPFVNTAAFPLKATLGGVALSSISMPVGGASFTARVGAHAAGAVALTVTSNGVTKAFTAAETDFAYAGNTVTVSPSSGPSNGGTVVRVGGAGFVTSGGGASTVTICGVAAPVTVLGSTVTSLVVTVPKFADATALSADPVDGPCTVKVTTGSTVSVVGAGSTFTYVAQG